MSIWFAPGASAALLCPDAATYGIPASGANDYARRSKDNAQSDKVFIGFAPPAVVSTVICCMEPIA
jgi:hypothetical protein